MRQRRKGSRKIAKNDVMSIRVSKEDKAKYLTEATNNGMNLSEYILYLLRHKAINVIDCGSEIVQAMYDLNCTMNKYGSNDEVSVNELKNAISVCVNKMNDFYERL